MSKLIHWNTPFAKAQFPGVSLFVDTSSQDKDIVKVVVTPDGIDKYPKYLLDFGTVLAYVCFEEANSPRDFRSVETEEIHEPCCSFEYLDSPWLVAYEAMKYFWGKDVVEFSHYLIFGGDNNIEVITPNLPTVEIIENKQTFKFEYEL